MAQTRAEMQPTDLWNVAALYTSLDEWENAFKIAEAESHAHTWPALSAYKGQLAQGSQVVHAALERFFNYSRTIEKLYTYAHLRHDEDITDDTAKAAYLRVTQMLHDFRQEIAWFEPELLALPAAIGEAYLNDSLLTHYRFYLAKIFRLRPHTLSSDKEELLALAAKAMQTPYKTFSAINNADFKFGTILDGSGQQCELTLGSYGLYMRSHDRTLRRNAFMAMHQKYRDFENTLAELIGGAVQGHIVQAQARGYNSCLEAALFPHNIDTTVYYSLIDAVHANLDVLHSYIDLRKRVLKISDLHLYDMYVPLISELEIKMSYDQAQQAVIEAVGPLGEEYQQALRRGLLEERWVDRYENANKRSGAYSSGCYDSYPYILMNYKGVLRDVFTLAHEAGHSMHSLLSHTHQPYHYGDYSIFVAEVASTFNEQLLMHYLLQRATSRAEKIFLINEKIEELRTTLFRQVMFAEFELIIHKAAEERRPLTPQFLRETYRTLNATYFGSEVVIDELAELEWARIPHFYYNFYVYQYATGISAAMALSQQVLSGDVSKREAYLQFLKGGSSVFPLDLLQQAGVDMRTPAPVDAAMAHFRHLVAELKVLLAEEEVDNG